MHIIAEQLPDGATWEDAIERLRFRQAVAEGKEAAANGIIDVLRMLHDSMDLAGQIHDASH